MEALGKAKPFRIPHMGEGRAASGGYLAGEEAESLAIFRVIRPCLVIHDGVSDGVIRMRQRRNHDL